MLPGEQRESSSANVPIRLQHARVRARQLLNLVHYTNSEPIGLHVLVAIHLPHLRSQSEQRSALAYSSKQAKVPRRVLPHQFFYHVLDLIQGQ